jgi:hypothetical protein
MLTRDGTRRRLPGDTFFQLVKDSLTGRERWTLFPPSLRQPPQQQPQKPQPQPLAWADVAIAVAIVRTTPPREARTMKLTDTTGQPIVT